MEKTTEEIIEGRLHKMTNMAGELKDNKELISQYANKDCYVRICGESFRAVSLRNDYPLCGCADNGTKRLETIERDFDEFEKVLKDQKRSISVKRKDKWPWSEEKRKKKTERSLQCWIIREALKNDRNLLVPLGISKHFHELRFALDEVSLGDKNHKVCDIPDINLKNENEKKPNAVRCDLLAVGKKNGKVFPIIIELKSNRAKKDLIAQVDNFAKLICRFKDYFIPLLETCTGLQINDNIPRKIIIWPELNSKAKTDNIEILNKAYISILEYVPPGKENLRYKFMWYPENELTDKII